MPIIVLDWSSKKLVRTCRSSLAADAQSATNGVDTLEWVKVYVSLAMDPTQPPEDDATMAKLGSSPFITDARALYDAARPATARLGIAEKRTAIEVNIINQRMHAAKACWGWTNTNQQLADGLTNVSQRQMLADVLSRGSHSLQFDPNFRQGKKVKQDVKKAMEE